MRCLPLRGRARSEEFGPPVLRAEESFGKFDTLKEDNLVEVRRTLTGSTDREDNVRPQLPCYSHIADLASDFGTEKSDASSVVETWVDEEMSMQEVEVEPVDARIEHLKNEVERLAMENELLKRQCGNVATPEAGAGNPWLSPSCFTVWVPVGLCSPCTVPGAIPGMAGAIPGTMPGAMSSTEHGNHMASVHPHLHQPHRSFYRHELQARPAAPRRNRSKAEHQEVVTAENCDPAPHFRTTVMLRNLPNNYTREMVMSLLDSSGFFAEYNFLYLPIDFQTRSCLGYAFVNLVDASVAPRFWMKFQNFSDWALPSRKLCGVSWSGPHQGLEAHIERYRNSPVMHASVPDEYKPVILQDGTRIAFPPPMKASRAPRVRHHRDLKIHWSSPAARDWQNA